MNTPTPEQFAAWLRALVPAIAGFAVLGFLTPAAAFGAVGIALVTALWMRNPFAGIGLAAGTLPLGAFLVDHPSLLRLALCVAVSAGIVWWYRREVRAAFSA
ncbi:MAG: hypothetical protein R2762_23885 [Bryobacteraceae bacterium]